MGDVWPGCPWRSDRVHLHSLLKLGFVAPYIYVPSQRNTIILFLWHILSHMVSDVVWFDAPESATHSISAGGVIVMKELTNNCWFHEPCQDGEAVCCCCCCWAAYIDGGARIGTKGCVNGELTMVGLGAATRTCWGKVLLE
jgi:hypothetical protein